MKKVLLILVLIGFLTVSVFADQFYLRNDTGYWTFYEVYISYNNQNTWGEDLLGYDVMSPGERVLFNSPRSLSSVTVDFMIVDEDGDTYTIYGKRVANGGTVSITLADLD